MSACRRADPHEDLRKQYTRLAECYLELAEAEAALRGKEPPRRSPVWV